MYERSYLTSFEVLIGLMTPPRACGRISEDDLVQQILDDPGSRTLRIAFEVVFHRRSMCFRPQSHGKKQLSILCPRRGLGREHRGSKSFEQLKRHES